MRALTVLATLTATAVCAAVTLGAPTGRPAVILKLTDVHVGYVTATVTGAAGTQVRLVEVRSGRDIPVTTLVIPRSGTAVVAHALTWTCAIQARTVQATVTGAPSAGTTTTGAGTTTVSSSITTPGCAGRIALAGRKSGQVGATYTLTVRDTWRVGAVRLRICTTPPGGQAACRSSMVAAGQATATDTVPLLRPGGWTLSVAAPGAKPTIMSVWAAHPSGRIALYALGDSEMQILDSDIASDLGGHGVSVSSDARISTGLTNSFLFNWQNEARSRAASLKPDVSVVFMGANDGFATTGAGGQRYACCGPQWAGGYANLVAEMMRTLLRGTAGRVYWYVLPTPRPSNFQSLFDGVNLGIREAAKRFPGRVELLDANAYFTPGNRYRDYMVAGGHGFTIHETDGIHLSASADVYAAQLLVNRLRADHIIH